MKETTICLLIILCLGVGALLIYYIYLVLNSSSSHKRDTQPPVKIGDIILPYPYGDNPFIDDEWQYETVTEVRVNDDNVYFFKSYTSNINGSPAPEQNDIPSHRNGARWSNSLYKIKGHRTIN